MGLFIFIKRVKYKQSRLFLKKGEEIDKNKREKERIKKCNTVALI